MSWRHGSIRCYGFYNQNYINTQLLTFLCHLHWWGGWGCCAVFNFLHTKIQGNDSSMVQWFLCCLRPIFSCTNELDLSMETLEKVFSTFPYDLLNFWFESNLGSLSPRKLAQSLCWHQGENSSSQSMNSFGFISTRMKSRYTMDDEMVTLKNRLGFN